MRSLLIAIVVGLSGTACSLAHGSVKPGDVACVGLSADICAAVVDAMAATARSEVTGSRVECTVPACTNQSGSLAIEVVRSDGTRASSNLSWENGFNAEEAQTVFSVAGRPIPTPPVAATCKGVPVDECQSNWATSMESVPGDQIEQVVRVLVECTAEPCTTASGSGRVTLWFRDGTSRVESTWDSNQSP